MRSFKTYLVVFVITITVLSADAQAPGYLGKHFIASYDLYTFPAISNPNANGKTGLTSFNTRHVFSVDWVTGLSQSIGMSIHLTKTQFRFKRGFMFSDGPSNEVEVNYGDFKGGLTAYAIGLHTNLYFNQFIAPMGSYIKPEILLVKFSATFDPEQAKEYLIDNSNQTMTTYPELANKKSYSTVAIGATLGTHYIFYDRLIFNIGFQFGWVVGAKKMTEWLDNGGLITNSVNESNYISVSSKSRLFSQYFINVNAGLGILIF